MLPGLEPSPEAGLPTTPGLTPDLAFGSLHTHGDRPVNLSCVYGVWEENQNPETREDVQTGVEPTTFVRQPHKPPHQRPHSGFPILKYSKMQPTFSTHTHTHTH